MYTYALHGWVMNIGDMITPTHLAWLLSVDQEAGYDPDVIYIVVHIGDFYVRLQLFHYGYYGFDANWTWCMDIPKATLESSYKVIK